MTPHKPIHSRYQSIIQNTLESLLGGVAVTELAIATAEGTRVADVVWMPAEEWDTYQNESRWPHAPEICVEVHSQSNTPAEMKEKMQTYFQAGAREVWFCNGGAMLFVSREGELQRSQLIPEFPPFIESSSRDGRGSR